LARLDRNQLARVILCYAGGIRIKKAAAMTHHSPSESFSPDLQDSVASIAPALPSLWMQTAVLQEMTDLAAAQAGFVTERISADLALWQSMCQCRCLYDLQHLHCGFMQNALVQYQAQVGRLAAVSGRIAQKLP
jgi:hypothetical protein